MVAKNPYLELARRHMEAMQLTPLMVKVLGALIVRKNATICGMCMGAWFRHGKRPKAKFNSHKCVLANIDNKELGETSRKGFQLSFWPNKVQEEPK